MNNTLTPVNNDSSPFESENRSSSFSTLFSLILNALEQKENLPLPDSSSSRTGTNFLSNQLNSSYYGSDPLSNVVSTTNKPATDFNKIDDNTINNLINQSAIKNQVDPKLVQSIIKHESSGNPHATSPAGAKGVMQLMPTTAASLGITDAYDPKQNIEGGTKYLGDLLKKYNGNKELALAAYNAGSGNVDKYDGIPPFKETQKYVRHVLDTYYS
ncbi:transglycosylase SLT domain-containing protein [Terrilactibacillus sp. BCM23-1]|uniref:Transglycosylase SLT domain-containing protein n=2 Tax=Terrilactibacillus tamarindi TaxID=2599694 RepID=A0A6N8CM99_9BACI|nr:transglycosylase SLT domain-containing protein [Terrilactibacillus tamarindi]